MHNSQPILNRTNIKSPTPSTRFIVWAGVKKTEGRMEGHHFPPTPKPTRPPTHRRAHTEDKASKVNQSSRAAPAPISMCTQSQAKHIFPQQVSSLFCSASPERSPYFRRPYESQTRPFARANQ